MHGVTHHPDLSQARYWNLSILTGWGKTILALTTPGHRQPEYPADPWAGGAAAQLLVPSEHGSPCYGYTRPAMATLIETARRWPHITEQLNPLLRERATAGRGGGRGSACRAG